jgi:hypothetical protein
VTNLFEPCKQVTALNTLLLFIVEHWTRKLAPLVVQQLFIVLWPFAIKNAEVVKAKVVNVSVKFGRFIMFIFEVLEISNWLMQKLFAVDARPHCPVNVFHENVRMSQIVSSRKSMSTGPALII